MNYKKEDPQIRHLSPMAEDFREVFQLGKDAHGISVTDLSGVSLAAIQALYREIREKQQTIEQLNARLVALEKALAELGR